MSLAEERTFVNRVGRAGSSELSVDVEGLTVSRIRSTVVTTRRNVVSVELMVGEVVCAIESVDRTKRK